VDVVGTIESLWRYPVKSMAGERLTEAYMGFTGFYGDRCYAFKNSAARRGFPYLNATAQQKMLRYRPKFRFPTKAAKPPNLYDAMSITPGVNPADAEPGDMSLDVETPSGAIVAIDDPALIATLRDGLRGENHITLVRSDRAMTDCRPISLTSLQTVRQIGEELSRSVDKRRFRANIYLDLMSDRGFAEDELVGRKLRLGSKAEVAVLERDPRCKIISLDPETGEHDPAVLRKVVQAHGSYAGVYCAVLVEGVLVEGDAVEVVD
jgi:uncharacterized protein YcbX